MFADYFHSESIRSHTVKDLPSSFGTEQNPILANNLTQIGLSQAKRRTPPPTQGPVRFRGIYNISAPLNPSTKNLKDFGFAVEFFCRSGGLRPPFPPDHFLLSA
jgi:hypothetical protein